jgi:hypothetical protein
MPERALNQAQARAVRAALEHVSDLLERVLRIAHGDLTPFDRQRLDLTPDETARLAEVVPAIRERMLDALTHLDVALPQSDRSARWTVRTALSFAEIALSEITPSELVGYGSLGEESAAAVTEVVADLRRMIVGAQDIVRDQAPPSA